MIDLQELRRLASLGAYVPVKPDELNDLLDVYEAACAWRDLVNWEDDIGQMLALETAIDRARGNPGHVRSVTLDAGVYQSPPAQRSIGTGDK